MMKLLKILSIGVAAALLLLLLTVLFLTSSPGENLAKGWLEKQLGETVGLPVSIGRFETNLWSRIHIDTLIVSSLADRDKQPLLYVGQIRVGYSIFQLLGETVTVKALSVDSVVVGVAVDSSGRFGVPVIDLPTAATADSGEKSTTVSIDTVSLSRMGLSYRDASLLLSVELAGAMLSARGTRDGAFSGRVAIETIIAVYDSLTLNINDVDVTAALDKETLRIEYAKTECEGLHLEARGPINLADDSFVMNLSVTVIGSLDTLASVLGAAYDLPAIAAGPMSAHGRIQGSLDNPDIRLHAELDDLVVRDVAVESVMVEAQYHDNVLLIDTLRITTLGGAISGKAAAAMDTLNSLSLNLALEDIELSSLWQSIYADASPFYGTVSGLISAEGRGSEVTSWTVAADVSGKKLLYMDRAVPDVRCTARSESGRTGFALVHGADTIHGDIEFGEDRVQGAFVVSLPDIRALARFVDQPDLSGGLWARGTIEGEFSNPILHATVNGSQITYRNFPVDSIFATLSYADSSLSVIDFVCAGRLDSIDSRHPPFALDSVAGSLAYDCRLQGPLMNLAGDIRAHMNRPRYGSYDIDSLSVAVTLSGSQITITECVVGRGELAARLNATYDTSTAAGSFDLLLQPPAVPSESPREPAPDTSDVRESYGSVAGEFSLGPQSDLSATVRGQGLWLGLLAMVTGDTTLTDGEASFDLAVEGPYLTPSGVLNTTVRSIRISDYRIDSVTARISVARDALHLDSLMTYAMGHTLRASGQLELSISPDGLYEVNDSASVTAELSTTDFDLSLLQGLALPEGEVSGAVSAFLGVSGIITEPRLNGWLRARNARILLEEGSPPVENVRLSLAFADSVLTIDSATAAVSDMAIAASGSITSSSYESASVDLQVSVGQLGRVAIGGTVSDTNLHLEVLSDSLNLNVFQPFMTAVDSLQGKLGCHIVIVGQPAAPQIDGYLHTGSLSLQAPRHHITLSNGYADVRFDAYQVFLDSAMCTLNGGQLAVSGAIAHQQGELTDIGLTLQATHITLQEPGTYVIAVDSAVLTYGKQQENYVLDGDVVLGETRLTAGLRPTAILPWVQSLETVDLELPELIARSRLDIRIRESDRLWVDNNLARIRLRSELGIIGTPLRPNFTGLVKIEEGYLLYLDRRFRVNEGSVYFSDPARFNPDIKLDASTQVKVYRRTAAETYTVYIGAEGLLDQLQYGLYSEPPLENPDIVALLTLGATRSELAGSGDGNGGGGLTGVLKDRAAMLTSQRVSGYLSRKAGSLFGFDEFTIQGNLFQFDESWGPQLVASKRLSQRVDLTYSTTVGHLNDQTMRLGYRLTPRFSLQGETDRQGRAGIDLKYGIIFK